MPFCESKSVEESAWQKIFILYMFGKYNKKIRSGFCNFQPFTEKYIYNENILVGKEKGWPFYFICNFISFFVFFYLHFFLFVLWKNFRTFERSIVTFDCYFRMFRFLKAWVTRQKWKTFLSSPPRTSPFIGCWRGWWRLSSALSNFH